MYLRERKSTEIELDWARLRIRTDLNWKSMFKRECLFD